MIDRYHIMFVMGVRGARRRRHTFVCISLIFIYIPYLIFLFIYIPYLIFFIYTPYLCLYIVNFYLYCMHTIIIISLCVCVYVCLCIPEQRTRGEGGR